jgi:hypothetical protein
MRLPDRKTAVAIKEFLAGRHFVEDRSAVIDIGSCVKRLQATDLFRRHIVEGTGRSILREKSINLTVPLLAVTKMLAGEMSP